ncbi:MAG: META domain-containing protein [Caldilineaceae bacterium]|nr:META domain-containing protein [Caldilineaceae bacterium]
MKLHTLLIVALLALALNFIPATAHAQDACPAIPADGPGVQRIDGQGSYSFWGIPAIIVDQPVVAMVDDSLAAQGVQAAFPDPHGQVLGMITSDFFTSPFSFTINLPAEGLGAQVDVDQDSAADAGVQIYQVGLAQNLLNTVPLVGIAQGAVLASYYRDAVTNAIVAGALVLYAPDDQQGFPCGYGADGELFTADDPIAALPQGFTVAHIADGAITFDRSPVASVEIFESPSGANPDFSDQGIVESFNTLIDFLRERYVFNNFEGVNDVDWDALYDTYLPRVEAAEAQQNVAEYALTLLDLAHDIGDAHVGVNLNPLAADPEVLPLVLEGVARSRGGIGADLVELDDGRIIVTDVRPESPAAAAGLTFGAQIVGVDGLSIDEALAQPVRFGAFPGTTESKRALAVQYLVKQPAGTDLEIAYQLPDSSEVMTTTVTAVPAIAAKTESSAMPMEYRLMDGIGYVTWKGFERTGIATHIFADFIKVMGQQQIPGIIIDVRGNGGGSALMEFAVLSYLFSPENPLSLSIADRYSYNPLTNEFVRDPYTMQLSAPPTTQPYLGDVVVLVNQHCVSACEFMSYWLQASGRATIVGQYSTEGGGGNVNAITMPGGFIFNYTAGTDIDNETDMPTFQAVGVVPDVRVPVTEETEQRKLEGGDPVLEAGIDHLRRLAFERLGHEPTTFVSGTVTSAVPTGWKPNADGTEYTSPDDPISLGIIAWTASAETDPDAIMAGAYPEIEKAGEIETDIGTWSIYGSEINGTYNVYSVIVIGGQPYIVTASTTDERLVPLMAEFILAPALHDFSVAESAAPAEATPANERITLVIELTTNPWLWTSFTDPAEQFDVETPEDYTITFNTDGTVNIKADCNNASGSYTADDNGSLSIEIGPMTRAMCPPGSRSDEFVQKLGSVANFFFENGILYLDMMADGGTFQLASASEHISN